MLAGSNKNVMEKIMQDIILVGAGGCMRELVCQMQGQDKRKMAWKILGYVENAHTAHGKSIVVGDVVLPYLGDDAYLLKKKTKTNVAICIGSPLLRREIAQKLMENPKICFPNMILGGAQVCGDVRMGQGCVVSADVRISTNVKLGDFVFLNIGSKICHDGEVGDFSTLSPDVTLAGNVRVGAVCDLGLGTKVIQGIRIGGGGVTGAGSVVVADVVENTVVAGVPARKM